jgi:hypothetical protein
MHSASIVALDLRSAIVQRAVVTCFPVSGDLTGEFLFIARSGVPVNRRATEEPINGLAAPLPYSAIPHALHARGVMA